jgi:hypothetical protein
LRLEFVPGSLIGENGLPMDSAQIGISIVPPELVRDMMPPGVTRHGFDITIQAPGVAAFTTPLPISFPNDVGLAPGTKANLLSFDHTTGRLEVRGSMTVSEDGTMVVSDPGTGITQPGWHWWINMSTGSAGSAPPPPPLSGNSSPQVIDVILPIIFGEGPTTFPTISFTPPVSHQYRAISISVDGPLSSFMKPTGTLPADDVGFVVTPGTSGQQLSLVPLSYVEMLRAPQGITSIDTNLLFGSKISVTEVEYDDPAAPASTTVTNYYLYRFVNATDPHHDQVLEFRRRISASAVLDSIQNKEYRVPYRDLFTAAVSRHLGAARRFLSFPDDYRSQSSF